jgi:N-acetylneuraminic acid mutarotase
MRWTVHIDGGPRRVNHAAVPVNGLIYSFGGYCTGDNYKDRGLAIDVFVLNPDSYRWHAVPKPGIGDEEAQNWPFQRYGHTVAAYGDKIYLFGGRNDEAPCNVLYCFNTKSYKWSRPTVRSMIMVDVNYLDCTLRSVDAFLRREMVTRRASLVKTCTSLEATKRHFFGSGLMVKILFWIYTTTAKVTLILFQFTNWI